QKTQWPSLTLGQRPANFDRRPMAPNRSPNPLLPMRYLILPCLVFLTLSCVREARDSRSRENSGWEAYAGGPQGNRYSPDDQIDLSNVHRLTKVWEFSSGDKDPRNRSQNQCNPIVVDGILYGTSPMLKLLALDATDGKPLWIFDPAKEDGESEKDPMSFYK